jgi:hypothetical protein
MENREKTHMQQTYGNSALREYEIRYRGSICPPMCVPIGTLSPRESLVLTNMARLITKIHEDMKLSGSNSLKSCSPETLYDFFENTPSVENDVANPIYQYILDEMK